MTHNHKEILSKLTEHYALFVDAKVGYRSQYRSGEQEQNLKELENYFPANLVDLNDVSLDLIKVWLLLLQKDYENNIPKILAYLEAERYGWTIHSHKTAINDEEYKCKEYNFINQCQCCRNKLRSRMSVKKGEDALCFEEKLRDVISKVFFDEKYGEITLIIFSYCISALFKSELTRSTSPLYLQIACENNTVLFDLISEIVTICDVNTGIHKECSEPLWRCGDDCHKTIYPTNNVDRTMDLLLSFRDTPFIIDGSGSNFQNYRALLREFANKSNNRKYFDIDSVLPIFICPEIKSDFNNVFNMDLRGVQVSGDYLDFIKVNRKDLSMIVFILIRDYSRIPHCIETGDTNLISLNSINDSIKYARNKAMTTKHARNVGVLRFFFTEFVKAFYSILNQYKFNEYEMAEFNAIKANQLECVKKFEEMSGESLVKIHGENSPKTINSVKITLDGDSSEDEKTKTDKARKYAADLVRIYQRFDTPLSIKAITVRDERYIFNVAVPEGVSRDKIFKNAENVRAALGVEYLKNSQRQLR